MTKRKHGQWVAAIILAVVLTDQLIKIYVKTHFALYEQVEILPWFKLYFLENNGMAFGLDFLGTAPLACFRIVAIALFIHYLRRIIKEEMPFGMTVCVSLIIAGALGNLIDNLFYGEFFTQSIPAGFGDIAKVTNWGQGYGSFLSGKVVDMFYFPLFTWPEEMPFCGGNVFFGAVFNFADAVINIGAFSLVFLYHKYLLNSREKQQNPENI